MLVIYEKQSGGIATTYVNADASTVEGYVAGLIAANMAPDLPWKHWVAVERSHPATTVAPTAINVVDWADKSSVAIRQT